MNEILKQYGFVYTGSCSCDGHHTEKYKFEDYQVRWRKKRGQFKIKEYGRSITGWMNEIEFINYLNKLNVKQAA